MLQPQAVVIMLSGYSGVPWHQLRFPDACLQKGETAATLLPLVRAVLCRAATGYAGPLPRNPLRGGELNLRPAMRNVFWRKEVLFMARWMERLTIAGVFVTLVLARVLCGLRSCSAGFAESIP
jgi:hypothetical protein